MSPSSWSLLPPDTKHAPLVATALVTSVVVASTILGFQALRRQERVDDLKASIPSLDEENNAYKLTNFGGGVAPMSKEDAQSIALAERAQAGDYDDDLILEQLARNRVFLTDTGLHALRTSFIIIVGCGGVGSHCATALARSGVSKIRLVDFDQVSLSSLNRHAVATLADVGTPKVHCLAKRLRAIVPWCAFDCRNQLYNAKDADALLAPWTLSDDKGRKPDFVVDAIDNITSKVDLLAYCHRNGIKVISSMGAGCKSDPTKIMIGDISATTDDPLSRSTRRRLRASPHNIATGIPCVFSVEKAGAEKAALLPLPEEEFQKGKVGELAPMADFRVRILPVLGTMPALFGYCLANFVICRIGGYKVEYAQGRARDKMYDAILAMVQGSEEKIARYMHAQSAATQESEAYDTRGLKLALNAQDVGYAVEEVWKGKSVVSGLNTRLTLVRWRRPTGAVVDESVEDQKAGVVTLQELVCMTREEGVKHEREVVRGNKTGEEVWGAEVGERVMRGWEEERKLSVYR